VILSNLVVEKPSLTLCPGSKSRLLVPGLARHQTSRLKLGQQGLPDSHISEVTIQQYRALPEPIMDSPDLSLAPPGMPPQFYPHNQSRATKSHNDALRKTNRKRVEPHKRSSKVRGYGRNHTEPQAKHSTRTISSPFSPSLTGNTININTQAPNRTTKLSGSPYASLQSRSPHRSDFFDFTSLRLAPHGYNHPPTVSGRESKLPTPMYSRRPSPGIHSQPTSPTMKAFNFGNYPPFSHAVAPQQLTQSRHSRSLAASAGEEAPTPTPSTPITPMHAKSFNPNGQPQQAPQQPPQAQAPSQQPIGNDAPFGNLTGLNFGDGDAALENFDFDSFLNTDGDSGGFEDFTNGVKAGDGTVVDEDRESKADEPMSPQSKPRRPYRSYHAPGTQFRVPNRPGGGVASKRRKNKSDNMSIDLEPIGQRGVLNTDHRAIIKQKANPPKDGLTIKNTISEDDTKMETRQQKLFLALERPSVCFQKTVGLEARI
jgi:hypothetical protein